MDIRYIHYIRTIAKLGSISLAANELFISQPSLSQRLRQYEDDLGYPIFFRTQKGLVLTREGEIFLKTARQIENLERSMRQQLADDSEHPVGTVRFGLSASRAPVLLPLILSQLQQHYPGIEVQIEEGRTKQLESVLKMGTIDLAFLVPPLKDDSIECHIFSKEEIVLAVPKVYNTRSRSHPSQGSLPWINLKDLSEYPFLLYDSNNRLCDFTKQLFLKEQFLPVSHQTFKDIRVLIGLARAGMGILVLPEAYADPKYELDYYSIGPQGSFRSLGLGYPPGLYRSKATECFAQFFINLLNRKQSTI